MKRSGRVFEHPELVEPQENKTNEMPNIKQTNIKMMRTLFLLHVLCRGLVQKPVRRRAAKC